MLYSAQSNGSPAYTLNRLYYKIRQIENFINTPTSGISKAQADTYYKAIGYVPAFVDITGKPTTISGYGITDALSSSGNYTNPSWLISIPFSKITSTPITVSGYGITDGVTLTGTQTLTNKTVNGVTPSTFGFIDPTSSIQTQLNNIVTTSNGKLAIANNLSDLNNISTARTNLGLGTIATQNANSVNITGGTITGLTALSTTGNPVFDAGSGTNTLTLRNQTISNSGGSFTFGNGGVFTGTLNAYRFTTTTTTEGQTGGTSGIKFSMPAFTASSPTTAGGTDATSTNFSLGIPTLTGNGITTTEAVNFRILGAPIAGTGQTITTPLAFKVDAGNSMFGGDILPSGVRNIGSAGSPFNSLFSTGLSYFKNIRAYDATGLGIYNNGNNGGIQIYSDGRVGMGIGVPTNNGTDQLQVAGNINATGNFTYGGTATGFRVQIGGTLSRNMSTEGSVGTQALFSGFTNNDISTAANTTIPLVINHGIGVPTYTATNTGQTYTVGANLYVAGPPTAGTNVTITNPYAIYSATGTNYFGGNILNGAGSFFQTSRILFNNASFSTGGVGTGGYLINIPTITVNDNATSANGTLAHQVGSGFGAPVFNSVNTGVTYTNASTMYIAGPPTAGTNVTIGSAYGLYLNTGNSYLGGNLFTNGSIVPNTHNTYNLGSTTSIWNTVYATNLYSPSGTSFNLGTIGANAFSFKNNNTDVGRIFAGTSRWFIGASPVDDGANTLQVNGSIKSSAYYDLPASDASGNGQYKIGGTRVLHNYGTGNIFVGVGSGNLTLTGSNNTVLGNNAGTALTTGSNNVLISGGASITTGSTNVFVGNASGLLPLAVNASGNTGIGQSAGRIANATTVTNNTFLGSNAGFNVTGTTYTNNVFLGNDAGNGEGNLTNTVVFGNQTTQLLLKNYGNLTLDAGSGTNTITVRTGTLSHNGTSWSLNGGSLGLANGITAGGTIGSSFAFNIGNTALGTTGGLSGMKLQTTPFTANDATTAASGTVANSTNFSLGVPTLTATNTGVTTAMAANFYIAGDPIAGTNQTITNSYGLYNAGKTYLGGNVTIAGSITAANMIGNTVTPSVAPSVGMGTSPTAISTTSSTSNGAFLNFTTGTSPTTGKIATISFGTTYSSIPKVQLQQYSDSAVTGFSLYRISNITTTGFDLINVGTSTLPASTAYSFIYSVSQ